MFEADESEWPIVSVRWVGTLADDDLALLFRRLDAWCARGERFGLMLDARGASGGMTAAQRRAVIADMKARAEVAGRLMVQAVVHDQVIHRALYSLVSAINPLPFPSKTFPEPESARTWLRDKLQSLTSR